MNEAAPEIGYRTGLYPQFMSLFVLMPPIAGLLVAETAFEWAATVGLGMLAMAILGAVLLRVPYRVTVSDNTVTMTTVLRRRRLEKSDLARIELLPAPHRQRFGSALLRFETRMGRIIDIPEPWLRPHSVEIIGLIRDRIGMTG